MRITVALHLNAFKPYRGSVRHTATIAVDAAIRATATATRYGPGPAGSVAATPIGSSAANNPSANASTPADASASPVVSEDVAAPCFSGGDSCRASSDV